MVRTAISPVPDAEHLVQEFLGVTEAARGDLLFELPHLLGQDREVIAHSSAERADDRSGEVERGGGLQPVDFQPAA